MQIELLYFDGCPNHEQFLPHLRRLLTSRGIDEEVVQRCVPSAGEALAQRFLGSPSLRIEGIDVEPGADARTDFGLKCRLYRTADGLVGVPPDEIILAALDAQRKGR